MSLIKNFCFFFLFSCYANAADLYKFDPNHTNINWSVSHFGFSNVSGKFIAAEEKIIGKILIDEANPKNSSIEVEVKIDALSTGISKFDNHLKSADFFDIEKFPTATFISKSVVLKDKNRAEVFGDLTLCGVTKSVALEVKMNKIGTGLMTQRKTIGFSATAKIKRSQFGMLFGLPGVSDEVKLQIEAEIILLDDAQKKLLDR